MESRISATEAARTFSDLLSRVRYRGETFVVERGGEPVCRMSPVATSARRTVGDLVRLLRSIPKPGDDYLEAVEQASKKQPSLPRSPWRR